MKTQNFNTNLMGTLWEPYGNPLGTMSKEGHMMEAGRTIDGQLTDFNRTCDGHVTDMCRTCDGHVSDMCATSTGEMNFANFAKFANFATSYFTRVAAMLLMILTLGVGEVWGENSIVTKNLAEATGTSPYTWTFGSSQSVKNTDIYVEVASASASGTIGVTCDATRSDRAFKVGNNTGTSSYTVSSYTKDVETSVAFTSSYVFSYNAKYYIRIYSETQDAKVSKITLTLGSSTKTVYLDLSSFTNWENADGSGVKPKFSVWDDDAKSEHEMSIVSTDCTNSHLYSAEVSNTSSNFYFKRLKSTDSSKWNEAKVLLSGGNNMARISDWNAGSAGVYSAPTFSVTYKANGGIESDIVVDGIACDGSHMVKAANTFSRTNWSFLKWNDGGGNEHTPGSTIEHISSNIDMYAHWKTWMVRGDFDGDSNWEEYQLVNDQEVTIPVTAGANREFQIMYGQTDVASQYYKNTGTMTSDNCTGWTMSTDAGSNCHITPTVTGEYTFTFDPSTKNLSVTYPAVVPVTGITVVASSYDIKQGETATITATVLPDNATDKSITWSSPRTGGESDYFTFDNTTANPATITAKVATSGKNITCTSSNSVVGTTTTQIKVYRLVEFTENGGSECASQKFYSGDGITLPTPTKANFDFAGWYSDSELNTKAGDAGATYKPNNNVTLYAKWTEASASWYMYTKRSTMVGDFTKNSETNFTLQGFELSEDTRYNICFKNNGTQYYVTSGDIRTKSALVQANNTFNFNTALAGTYDITITKEDGTWYVQAVEAVPTPECDDLLFTISDATGTLSSNTWTGTSPYDEYIFAGRSLSYKKDTKDFKFSNGNSATISVPSNIKVTKLVVTGYSSSSEKSTLTIEGTTATPASLQFSTSKIGVEYAVTSPVAGKSFEILVSNKEMEIESIALYGCTAAAGPVWSVYSNVDGDWKDYPLTDGFATLPNVTAKQEFGVKIRKTDDGGENYTYYGAENYENSMTGSNCSNWTLANPGHNVNITADSAGYYTVQYNTETNKLSVVYPTTYYVYFGETLTLPAGTYTKGTATQHPAKYASTLTPEVVTKQYTDGNVLSGNTYQGNTLGEYYVTKIDGTHNATIYVYRFYAKHPWGTCAGTEKEEYDRSWVWRAMDRENGVTGAYGTDGNTSGANVAWDYAYDWDGLYMLEPIVDGIVEPANRWADGTETSTGGNAWKGMNIAEVTCGESMVQFTYSGIPATSTSAPSVVNGDSHFTGVKVSVTYYILTFGSTEGGAVSTDWGSDSPVKVEAGKTVKFSALAEDGYTFEGWYGNAECTGEKLGTELNYVIENLTSDKTVYAKFEAAPCFTFTCTASLSTTVAHGASFSTVGSLDGGTMVFERSGSSMTVNSDGVKFNNDAEYIKITLSAPLAIGSTITARIKASGAGRGVYVCDKDKSQKFALNVSASATETLSHTVVAGDNLAGEQVIYLVRSTSKTAYLQELTITGCGSMAYTVTYDANGATSGTVPVDENSPYAEDATVTILNNTGSLARTGYTFAGWNSKANGSGADYAAGATIEHIGANIVLYAKWTAKTTTVTIDANTANHGSTAPTAITATYGAALPAFTAATGEANYSLKGYYTAAVGGNLVINADGTLAASVAGYTDANKKWAHDADAVTLYAQYDRKPCASVIVKIPSSSNISHSSQATKTDLAFTSGEATVDACSAAMGHVNSSATTLEITKLKGYKLGDKMYMKITLDNALNENDKIQILSTGDIEHQYYLTTSNDAKGASGDIVTVGQEYTVTASDALEGQTTFYIWRAGTTMYIHTVNIFCSTGCTKPDLAYATATVSKQVGAAAFTNTLTNTNGVNVVYSSTNEAVATVASNGQVTIVGGGTTTIKATAAEQTKGGTTYCEREVSYILNVCASTSITTQPASTAVNRGESHTLTVVATGTNLSYQWYSCATENGTYAEIKGATSASYTFAALDNRYYYCKITNGCGDVTNSNKARITLEAGTPTFTWTVAETVYQGQQVPFTVQTNSDATLAVGSVTLTGGSGNSLQNVTVNGNTITGTLVVNTTNTTDITLNITTDATTNFAAGNDSKVIEISEECPTAGTEVVYSYTLTSDNINKTDVTCTGGTATTNGIKTDEIKTYDSKDFFKTAGSIAETKNYIRANMNTALKEGDVITLVCANASSSTKAAFSIYAGTTTSSPKHAFVITDNRASQSVQYTVQAGDGLVGETQFQLGRDDSNAFIYSISVTSTGKVGSLQWEDSELSDGDVVVKKTGDAAFTNVAIATSAGTITYSSNEPSVADVNSTGEVTIGSTGRATITASLAAHGCYSAQTITYIVEVQSDCTAPTITAQPADAEYEVNVTATALSVAATGTSLTYQWYSNTTKSNENGTLLTGEISATYIPATTAKGTYYYYCVVTSETYCSTVSDVATITVTKTCGTREAPMIKVIAHTGTELCWQTITLKAVKQDGTSEFGEGTYKWYKDEEEIVGRTSNTLVVNEAGVYYVEHVVSDCPMESSNRAYVEHKDAMAQRLTPFQYYHAYKVDDEGNHVDWTYSDQMKDRHLFAVRGLSKVNEKTYEVSASLKQDADDASPADKTTEVAEMLDVVPSTTDASVDTLMLDLNKLESLNMEVGNELVISVAPYDCQDAAEAAQSITIYVVDEKPALAFIVPGADGEGTKTKKNLVVGGDFLTGYNKADLKTQTSSTEVSAAELPLYAALKANFHTTPVNGYAPFNKLNYEPFDLVFLTDFVKTDGSGDASAAKAKVNDLGLLVDYRPLFSTKCHMSNISNWTKVGFTANPVVPAQTQLWMNIVCYAHPMFEDMAIDGTNIFTDSEEPDETVFKMITSGGFDKSKGIQGFELSAAENFVVIAQTHNDAHGEVDGDNSYVLKPVVGANDKILVASCERQTNVEARMILLSLNADATSNLTPAGIDVIIRSLNYLMETDPLKVTDCHFEFDDATGNHLWSTPGNWAPRHSVLPTKNVNVRISKNCIVDSKNAVAGGMKIRDGVTVTINADAGLQLTGMARHLEDDVLTSTSAEELIVKAGDAGSGAFIHGDDAAKTDATVEFYSISGNALVRDGVASAPKDIRWQWMTTPFAVNQASTNYDGAWIFAYTNSNHLWDTEINTYSMMYAFRGYEITQDTRGESAHTYTMTGTLASTANQDLPLYSGLNLIGNSWTAPINIDAMKVTDFDGAEATIVMLNTGNDNKGNGAVTTIDDALDEDVTTPGTYVSIPVNTAKFVKDKLKVIPAMQAFEVRTNKGVNGTLHLNYDRIVRKTGNVNIQPMRAPERKGAATVSNNGIYSTLRIYVQGSRYGDYLYIYRNDETTMDFDNGWDGRKYMSSNLDIPVLMVRYGTNNWQISTQPEYVGTELAFYQGEDSVYTMGFRYDGEETLWLYDSTEDTYTEVNSENTYTFTSNTTKLQKRFVLVGYNPNTPEDPGISTGVDNVTRSENGPRKLILDDKLFILNQGRLYDATGRLAY